MLDSYSERISNRSFLKFTTGFIARIPRYLKFRYSAAIARRRGANIGNDVCIFHSFAKKLDKNVTIGNHTSISKCEITTPTNKINIGNNVIIGADVKFLRGTHDIDAPDWTYKPACCLKIEDYVWICPYAIILPSVKYIGRGAVIGAGSVVASDVQPMSVVAGNPAKEIRKRECVHHNICVESLLGGDLATYYKIWKQKN